MAEGILAATIIGPTTTGPALKLIAGALGGQPVPSEIILQPKSHPPVEDLAARAAGRS